MRNHSHQRPRIEVSRTLPDYVGEALAISGVLGGVLLLLILWADLPQEIPQRFGITGHPADWTDRWIAFFPVSMAVGLYIGLTFLNRYPHIFNYPWPINEHNAVIQYRLARSMITWLKALCVLMLVAIVWSQARVALGNLDSVSPFMIMGFIITINAVLLLFVYRAYRCQDGDTRNDPFGSSNA
jgi:hypothetical protein